MNDSPLLAPLPYHREIRDYLKANERELWKWYASARAAENFAEQLRLDLLKSTYRLAPESHPALHASAISAANRLGLQIPVHLYQSQQPARGPNAALFHLPREAHIVLSGPILSLLAPEEITSVFAHELAHHLLWTMEGGDFLIVDRILHAVTAHAGATRSHHETARQYRLYTEIYADRGAAHVAQDLSVVIAALVKTMTGIPDVSGQSYLTQAAEIFAKQKVRAEELSHPESFIRTHALELWTRQGEAANDRVRDLIGGETSLHSLDLLAQNRLSALTRRFLGQLLRPAWFRTEATLGQARLFFPDFQPSETEDPTLPADLLATGPLLQEYFLYLLLDYVGLDRQLEELPLACALRWTDNLGATGAFEKLVTKELRVKPRDIAKLKPRIADLLALAEQGR